MVDVDFRIKENDFDFAHNLSVIGVSPVNKTTSMRLVLGSNELGQEIEDDVKRLIFLNTGYSESVDAANGLTDDSRLHVYEVNGSIFIATLLSLQREGTFHKKACVPYIMNKLQSFQVDTPEDFKIMEVLIRERDNIT